MSQLGYPTERFVAALGSGRPSDALAMAASSLLAGGETTDTLIAGLEEVRETLILEGRSDDEDMVLDLMDRLTGWCGPYGAIPFNREALPPADSR
jgi:hypothetical protein